MTDSVSRAAAKSERRRHPRIREENVVAVTVLESPDVPELVNRTFFCHSEDLSLSGIRLHVPVVVPPRAALILRIAFSDPPKAFRRFGTVVWSRGSADPQVHDAGAEFAMPSSESESDWRSVIDAKVADASA